MRTEIWGRECASCSSPSSKCQFLDSLFLGMPCFSFVTHLELVGSHLQLWLSGNLVGLLPEARIQERRVILHCRFKLPEILRRSIIFLPFHCVWHLQILLDQSFLLMPYKNAILRNLSEGETIYPRWRVWVLCRLCSRWNWWVSVPSSADDCFVFLAFPVHLWPLGNL